MRLPRAIIDFFQGSAEYLGPKDIQQAECGRSPDLDERLAQCERIIKERGALLYDVQQQYASEHFKLREAMRDLKTERMRNAGLFGDRDAILERADMLLRRIADLKARLERHEPVEDEWFDDQPIVLSEQRSVTSPDRVEG
ncbi:MAG: hypothetical protein ACYDGM_06115 [Vulcanimicrobiaceae bacterium]